MTLCEKCGAVTNANDDVQGGGKGGVDVVADEDLERVNVMNKQFVYIMRECYYRKVDWGDKGERVQFLRELNSYIHVRVGLRPNLREVFITEDIDLLLNDCIDRISEGQSHIHDCECEMAFVEFVARTGYKDDETYVDKERMALARRAKPVHRVAKIPLDSRVVESLLKIYNWFDVNYAEVDGLETGKLTL
ncbi:hypothetical protein TKK_0017813 [Trichogramma kaykai]